MGKRYEVLRTFFPYLYHPIFQIQKLFVTTCIRSEIHHKSKKYSTNVWSDNNFAFDCIVRSCLFQCIFTRWLIALSTSNSPRPEKRLVRRRSLATNCSLFSGYVATATNAEGTKACYLGYHMYCERYCDTTTQQILFYIHN